MLALAARFLHYGLPMADLVPEGHVGLARGLCTSSSPNGRSALLDLCDLVDPRLHPGLIFAIGQSFAAEHRCAKALFFICAACAARLTRGGEERISSEVHAKIAEAIGVSKARMWL